MLRKDFSKVISDTVNIWKQRGGAVSPQLKEFMNILKSEGRKWFIEEGERLDKTFDKPVEIPSISDLEVV